MRLGYVLRFVRLLLGISLILLVSDDVHASETILWQESFDDATATGWRYYTTALEFRDVMTVSPRFTLTKKLFGSGLSFPMAKDVFLTFSYYCRAERSAEDEVIVSIVGKTDPSAGRRSEGFGGSLTIPVGTDLNRWRTVTVPLAAFGPSHIGKSLNYAIHLAYYRPLADDYALIVDDIEVTRGTTQRPVLIDPTSLLAIPSSISPNGDRL